MVFFFPDILGLACCYALLTARFAAITILTLKSPARRWQPFIVGKLLPAEIFSRFCYRFDDLMPVPPLRPANPRILMHRPFTLSILVFAPRRLGALLGGDREPMIQAIPERVERGLKLVQAAGLLK